MISGLYFTLEESKLVSATCDHRVELLVCELLCRYVCLELDCN